ncbi:peptidoglycan-binding protein [Streptomyces polyrhachis]|uniref:Peptidoglycan-binding protein n=1 Tax=Streptomyces polyrhachis TaxID=1282885 RepID=A0ABW2GDQ6_9ACTN
MAQPLSADQFLSVLKSSGVRVVTHGSWRTHNRDHKGPWGPVHGVMVHHTGPYATEAGMVDFCRTGYPDLPGPLCHGVVDRAGTVHLVGYGRTNHAGAGDGDVLAAVIAEKPLPPDNEADTDGNRHFYGFECINTGGGQKWTDAQLKATHAVSAALCRAHGRSERSVIAHKEWQPGRPDPAGIDMADFRTGRSSPLVTAMGKRLVAGGCGRYRSGPSPRWTDADRCSYAAWQRKLGYSGADADGIPGPTSWAKLHVPQP